MKIEELMTRDVIAVGPETSLKDVAATLAERRISGLPVVGERRIVLGVVSEADILVKELGHEPRHGGLIGWLLQGERADDAKLAAWTAGEAMQRASITIRAEKQICSEVARLMMENGIKRLPIVTPTARSQGSSRDPTSSGPSPGPTRRSNARSVRRSSRARSGSMTRSSAFASSKET